MIRWIEWAVGLTAAAVAFAARVAVRSYLDERSDFTRWPRSPAALEPTRTGIAGLREVCFSAPGRPRLAGWYAPSRNTAAVILVHGTASDRASLLAETRILARAGFGVLALDLPGQGASDGHTLWGVAERSAISQAADWLATRPEIDPARIGGFGLSMGAYVLIQAAARDPRLRAVALAASPSDVVAQNRAATARYGPLSQWPNYWALRASGMPLDERPIDVIGAIAPRAVLIFQGLQDRTVPPDMARQLFEAAGEPRELWLVANAGHADFAQVVPEEYRDRLGDFFGRTLLAP